MNFSYNTDLQNIITNCNISVQWHNMEDHTSDSTIFVKIMKIWKKLRMWISNKSFYGDFKNHSFSKFLSLLELTLVKS